MAFQITITDVADSQFRALSVRDRRILEAAIQTHLSAQPTRTSKAVKRLRPNAFAAFELRVGDLRVLYNVDADEVTLLLVGRKGGNKLIVDGEEFHGHRDDAAQSTGGEPPVDVE